MIKFILPFLLLFSPLAWATNGYVQSCQGFDTTGTTATCSMGSLPKVGDIILCTSVLTTSTSLNTTYTLADNQSGNTYNQTAIKTINSGFGDGFGAVVHSYAVVNKSSGTFTITLTYNPGQADQDFAVGCNEYNSLNTSNPNQNVTNSGSGTSNTTASPGAVSPTTNNTLCYSSACDFSTISASAWTIRLTANGSTNMIASADNLGIGSSTGSFTITTGHGWISVASCYDHNHGFTRFLK